MDAFTVGSSPTGGSGAGQLSMLAARSRAGLLSLRACVRTTVQCIEGSSFVPAPGAGRLAVLTSLVPAIQELGHPQFGANECEGLGSTWAVAMGTLMAEVSSGGAHSGTATVQQG